LTAITAAVVGVILNLALFFSYHVLWPHGLDAGWLAGCDGVAVLIALGAALALLRFKRTVIEVIAACAVLGLVLSWMR
jgi:chromate transporter